MRIGIYFSFLLAPLALDATAGLVFSGRLGSSWAEVGHDNRVALVKHEPAPDAFDTTQATSTRLLLGVFIGPEYDLYQETMRWQTGVSYYANPNPYQTEGIRYAYSLPDEGNIRYSYEVFSQRLLFENKYLWEMTDRLFGYLMGGLGVAFNEAKNYQETALNGRTLANGNFEDHTYTAFTYTLGLGLEVAVIDDMRVGLGYQFSDLGKVSLGDFNQGNLGATLMNDHTPTQELVFLLSYTF